MMVRRKKEEALATREALLDAAEQIFREHGVTRATLGAVAGAARVTRGALYWHFRDKDELFAAMCKRATLPMQSRLEQAAASDGDDAMLTLRNVAVQGLREIAANPRTRAVLEIVLCKSEQPPEDEGAPQAEAMDRECAQSTRRITSRAVAQGRLPADTDCTLAAYALQAYFRGITQLWLTQPTAFDLTAAAEPMIDAMIAGLLAAPPRRR